jgi:circadian clock protein KaiB
MPPASSGSPAAHAEPIHLRLYIAGDSPRSQHAILSLRRLDGTSLAGRYRLEVVDVLQEPAKAEEDHVIATPTLLRISPSPRRRILGDLTELDQLVRALGGGEPRSSAD